MEHRDEGCVSPNIGIGVAESYAGKTVFITGATGFLGGVLVEKILRSCPLVEVIYVLVRKKKKFTDIQERLTKMLSLPIFSGLDKEVFKKVVALEGDVGALELGLDSDAKKLLKENTNFVFHVAASINFNAPLSNAIRSNLLGTRHVLEMAKSMPHLQAFVYVSTAFCNCTLRDTVAEKIYPNQWEPSELINMIETLSSKEIDENAQNIIGGHPNTYSFTKLMAENLLQAERGIMPIAIVRPSVGTLKSPLPGWVDNVHSGAFGFIAGAGRGVFRTMPTYGDKLADLVPCDLLISLILASAWKVSQTKTLEIFNFTSAEGNTLTWYQYCELAISKLKEFPCLWLVFYPRAKCRGMGIRNKLYVLYAHYLPGVILDVVSRIRRVKPILLDIQYKYTKGMLHVDYFTNNQWQFSSKNTKALFESLNEKDKENFDFDNSKIDWPKYMESCVLGIRNFYHNQSTATLPLARKYLKIWWCADKLSWIILFLIVATMVLSISNSFGVSIAIAFFVTLLYIWF